MADLTKSGNSDVPARGLIIPLIGPHRASAPREPTPIYPAIRHDGEVRTASGKSENSVTYESDAHTIHGTCTCTQ